MKSAEDFEALKVIGSVWECLEMDRRHRVRISDRMLEHVGITDRAVLVAGAHQIEAWNPERLRRKE